MGSGDRAVQTTLETDRRAEGSGEAQMEKGVDERA